MPDQKKGKQRTFMYLPASINFHINWQRDIQHSVSVKRLKQPKITQSRRVAEVNKFGINRQKQATHVSGRRKRA